jgi:hypothetical protein
MRDLRVGLFLPRAWGGYSAKRALCGRRFAIVVDDPDRVGRGDAEMRLAGQVHFGRGFQACHITEKGTAVRHQAGADRQVEDPMRGSCIRRHLKKVLEAIATGIPVQGYSVWSLLDNFE